MSSPGQSLCRKCAEVAAPAGCAMDGAAWGAERVRWGWGTQAGSTARQRRGAGQSQGFAEAAAAAQAAAARADLGGGLGGAGGTAASGMKLVRNTWAPRQLGCASRVLHRLDTTHSPLSGAGSVQALESPTDKQDVLVVFESVPRKGIMNCNTEGGYPQRLH